MWPASVNWGHVSCGRLSAQFRKLGADSCLMHARHGCRRVWPERTLGHGAPFPAPIDTVGEPRTDVVAAEQMDHLPGTDTRPQRSTFAPGRGAESDAPCAAQDPLHLEKPAVRPHHRTTQVLDAAGAKQKNEQRQSALQSFRLFTSSPKR